MSYDMILIRAFTLLKRKGRHVPISSTRQNAIVGRVINNEVGEVGVGMGAVGGVKRLGSMQ